MIVGFANLYIEYICLNFEKTDIFSVLKCLSIFSNKHPNKKFQLFPVTKKPKTNKRLALSHGFKYVWCFKFLCYKSL